MIVFTLGNGSKRVMPMIFILQHGTLLSCTAAFKNVNFYVFFAGADVDSNSTTLWTINKKWDMPAWGKNYNSSASRVSINIILSTAVVLLLLAMW